jgi:RNA polymerase sigma-70 factor (ECF subfamily)
VELHEAPAASRPVTSDAIAEHYRPAILRYIRRLVGDAALAEDLTQETFLRVHRHLAELQEPAALDGWLYRIATNVCYDRFRQPELRSPPEPLRFAGEAEERPVPDEARLRPDQLVDQNAMSECVRRFLAGLPAEFRTVLLLHDLQGYSDPEIAAQLGVSLANVKVRLHRARAKLKTALAGGCDFTHDEQGVLVCHPKPPAA